MEAERAAQVAHLRALIAEGKATKEDLDLARWCLSRLVPGGGVAHPVVPDGALTLHHVGGPVVKGKR
jgi:hypothetical protein